MAVLTTPFSHFQQDISRADDLRQHAAVIPASVARDDIMRSAWMMAVGAVDAYFCDAYADLLARTLQARNHEPSVDLPSKFTKLRVPVIAVIRPTVNDSWRWRMAARELIEDHSVLSLDQIRSLFNQFCRDGYKMFANHVFDGWVLHRDHKQRLFGISRSRYRATTGAARNSARESAKETFQERFAYLFQRRHDCIHNCDRPKVALDRRHVQSATAVEKVIFDLQFLVSRCHQHLETEFPQFLAEQGYSGVTRNRVGA